MACAGMFAGAAVFIRAVVARVPGKKMEGMRLTLL